MRYLLLIIIFFLPLQAFCTKNFLSGPNERELHFAYLVIAGSVAISMIMHYLYYKTKWFALKVINIILLIFFGGIAFIGLLFSPPASMLGLIIVIASFILSIKKEITST